MHHLNCHYSLFLFMKPSFEIFLTFKFLLELNRMYNLSNGNLKLKTLQKDTKIGWASWLWEGVMVVQGARWPCHFMGRRQVWAKKIMSRNIHRKWIKITLLSHLNIVPLLKSAKKCDYTITFVARMEVRVIFLMLTEVGSINYFKATMLLRALKLWVIEGNFCKQITL